MDNKYEKAYINAANSVLSKHFRSDMYSFDGIVDAIVDMIDRIAGKQSLQLRGEFYDQVLRKDIA